MYNESIKKAFINDITRSESTARDYQFLFDSFEKYEVELNKDICQMSVSELQPIVDAYIGVRGQSRTSRLIRLRTYVKWCLNTQIYGARDDMLRVKSAGLDKMRMCMVSSPVHLEAWLNQLYTPVSHNTVDCIYRCFIWLSYAGMDEEDILKITPDNVDFNDMMIHYNEESYPIYREAVPTLKKCIELGHFTYVHPNYNKNILKERAPGNQLIRGLQEMHSLKVIRVTLSRQIKRKEEDSKEQIVRLSCFRIWLSGVFYRMYEAEQIGFKPNFKDVVEKHFRGRTYKLDSGRNTINAKKQQKQRDYLEDYRRWKLAFNI